MYENEPDGATPLDADEVADLLPSHIRTRSELNLWEQENILVAARWSGTSRQDTLNESFVRELHRRMFDRTWKWAGKYRTSDKNIGVYWPTISTEVKILLDDGRYWLDNAIWSIDESALRLHHRLVKIHLFPNGNGRHARLWCDTLLNQHGRHAFNWKNPELDRAGKARQAYICALRAADDNDYSPLFELILTNR